MPIIQIDGSATGRPNIWNCLPNRAPVKSDKAREREGEGAKRPKARYPHFPLCQPQDSNSFAAAARARPRWLILFFSSRLISARVLPRPGMKKTGS